MDRHRVVTRLRAEGFEQKVASGVGGEVWGHPAFTDFEHEVIVTADGSFELHDANLNPHQDEPAGSTPEELDGMLARLRTQYGRVLFHHQGGVLSRRDAYVGTSDQLQLLQRDDGQVELWLNGCLVHPRICDRCGIRKTSGHMCGSCGENV